MIDLPKYTKELGNLIAGSENILIISHINPDGDAIGSQLALYHFLKSINKNVGMISPNYLQEFLKWMDGSEIIEVFIRDRKKCLKLISDADLIIIVDFNQPGRMGEAEEAILNSKAKKVMIDHHLEPGSFCDIVISDPSKCATAELVFEIVKTLNSGNIFTGRSFAECIYVGIVTDTGNFEHGSYSADTFRLAALLLESGIRKEIVLNLVYNNFSADRMKLLGYALYQRMTVIPEHKTAYIYLTKEDIKNFNHVKGDTEGFVNYPLSIKGIRFSVLFIEKEGFIKLSFRSKGSFPTNKLAAKYFGGGGHLNASGGEYHDSLQNTINYFLDVLNENSPKSEEDI
ncbi:MAG TPA: bifunctional oligoribonuclease/PAP phosphatase NrnA [Bacteroidales bacterium]|nr:bifunctional oligoribonuclease/PAP phosphatase NrnA [Bacteroidales bacterium]